MICVIALLEVKICPSIRFSPPCLHGGVKYHDTISYKYNHYFYIQNVPFWSLITCCFSKASLTWDSHGAEGNVSPDFILKDNYYELFENYKINLNRLEQIFKR